MGYYIIGIGSILMAVELVLEKIIGNTQTLPVVHKVVFGIAYICFISGLIVDLKDELGDVKELAVEVFKHLIFIGAALLVCYILSTAMMWGIFLLFILAVIISILLGLL
jgi:phosphatidylserine synthase